MSSIRILLWNVQWQRARTDRGAAIRSIIAAHDPDLICLTESNLDLLDETGRIVSDADFGYPIREDRRKVLLWSRWPWQAIDNFGDAALPKGRFVRGRLATPYGPLDVIGVCIPWSAAHVSTGRRDSRPWQEHTRYLDGLSHILDRADAPARTILLGDFNQAIPRRHAPIAVFERLEAIMRPRFAIATAGAIAGLPTAAIDHVAHGRDLAPISVTVLPNQTDDGRRLSDHTGLLVTLSLEAVQLPASSRS